MAHPQKVESYCDTNNKILIEKIRKIIEVLDY
jgi:hypothetical protein